MNNRTRSFSPYTYSKQYRQAGGSPFKTKSLHIVNNRLQESVYVISKRPKEEHVEIPEISPHEKVISPIIINRNVPREVSGILGKSININYSNFISAGHNALAFNVSAGMLPTGLELNSNGVLSGIPTEESSDSITMLIESPEGPTESLEIQFKIRKPVINLTHGLDVIDGYVGNSIDDRNISTYVTIE